MRFEPLLETSGGTLQFFSIYTDFGGYRRARWVVNAVAKLAGQRWQCPSEIWKLDSFIVNGPIRNIVTDDCAQADVLTVVIGSLDHRRPELLDWLGSLTPLGLDRPGLLIGVLGDEDDKGRELDWTTNQLIHCAQKTNRKFLWHWIQHHDGADSDWLADGAAALLARKRLPHRPMISREAVVA